MNERVQWSCLVNRQAKILEWEDKSGATYLSQIPLISGYAQALLYSRFNRLSFYFQHQNQWFKFDLTRQQADFALVQAVKNELPFELSNDLPPKFGLQVSIFDNGKKSAVKF